ncbi:MAG: DNA polymerase III subunit gamma/tau [Gammaproteobacteria bacterium]|nr:DNA polymerase III subunit gamma/tau [Gammaproteobacteria bacterium]
MAYLALARKWRPRAFAEVVGQSHVVQALSNALDSGRVHHAFLFTGTRGVGKTTLARIFAKSLNCEQGTSAEPCQQCNTCNAIDEGRFVDLIEVDAASRTKVDDTREMLENVQYAPTSGRYKVYLIDEVHMLSGHSFNALLKTLEEPPEHVKFLFATTDPQKLPVTVLSRCLQFNLRAMRPEQVENQLVKILGSEGLEFDQAALHAIAKAADGSMRDGLSLLDQAIAQGGGSVKLSNVESMLGTIRAQHSEAILRALAAQDVDEIMRVIADMADNAVDFASALDDLLVQLYYLSMAQLAPAAFSASDANQPLISELSGQLDAELVQLYYQTGLLSKRDLPLAPTSRVGFEMALLRMLCFSPVGVAQGSSAPAPQTVAAAVNSTPAAAVNSTPAEAVNPTPAEAVNPTSAEALTQPTQPPAQKVAEAAAPGPVAVTLAGNNEWGELLEQTQLSGLSKELAMHCACEKLSKEKIQLSLSPKSQHLLKPERLDDIKQHLRATMNTPVEVELEIEDSDKETPAECLDRLGFEQHQQTRESLQNDPGVKALMSEFGATINEQSIKTV